MRLAKALDPALQDDVRLGLLSATAAREISRLPRGNQLRAAEAVREVLTDPLRYLGAEAEAASAARRDPRLSEGGNRLLSTSHFFVTSVDLE